MSMRSPAHFGLGQFDRVSRIEVDWSTGEREVIEGDFPAGARYRITRSESSAVSGAATTAFE